MVVVSMYFWLIYICPIARSILFSILIKPILSIIQYLISKIHIFLLLSEYVTYFHDLHLHSYHVLTEIDPSYQMKNFFNSISNGIFSIMPYLTTNYLYAYPIYLLRSHFFFPQGKQSIALHFSF